MEQGGIQVMEESLQNFQGSNAESAWERFEHSGSVADYLSYRQTVILGENPIHATQNTGAGSQTAQYRGK